MDLLEDSLDLENVRNVLTLEGLRDLLPDLSNRMKSFSASSNSRFVDADGLELIGAKEVFYKPRAMFSLDLPLSTQGFTLSAWVERLAWPQKPGAIMRKKLPTNPELSCYAWMDQAEVFFGAHDFYAVKDGGSPWQESVRADVPEAGPLTHEALVVDGTEVRFYRDGMLLGTPQQLPRDFTDCNSPDPLEVGSENLALYAVKFYPRALPAHQIEEMFREGQPLLELSTGYILRKVMEGDSDTVKAALEAGDRRLERTLWRMDNTSQTTAQAVASRDSTRQADDSNDHLFPPDGAPSPYLPKGASAAGELNERDRAVWEAGGSLTQGFVRDRWQSDADVGSAYWSVFEAPVFTDGSTVARLRQNTTARLGEDGVTLSFWFRPSDVERGFGPDINFRSEDGELRLGFRVELDWVEVEVAYQKEQVYVWQYMTGFDADTGKTDESFLFTAFVQEPGPSVWRHVVLQYSQADGSVSLYLDGRGVLDSKDRPRAYVISDAGQLSARNRPSPSDLLHNTTLTLHDWSRADEYPKVAGKVAQLRLYPRLLTPAQVLTLSDSARWPSGDPVRQCYSRDTDHGVKDSKEVDEDGRSCEFYHRAMQTHPIVCAAPKRKQMCPVVCKGVKLCHDGSLARDNPGVRFPMPRPRRTYNIFNRTMWLKPRERKGSLLCPASTVDRAELKARCEANAQFVNAEGVSRNFSWYLSATYEKVDMADLRKCDELLDRLDEQQCAWDASWLPEFQRDFAETGTWSMRFWAKPVEGSLGMPTNFWFGFMFLQSLSPPLLLAHLAEREPTLEPWLDMSITVREPTRLRRQRAAVWPTTLVPFTDRWTLFHMQVEKRPNGKFRICGTLNAMPLDCTDDIYPQVLDPASFLEAFEVTTEMLLSPIEFTTSAFTPSQVQEYFYSTSPKMDTLLGPRITQLELLEARSGLNRTSATYDQRALLLAPPIILQSRKEKKPCQFKVSGPILQKQQELLEEAHCGSARCDAGALEMVTCLGDDMQTPFFGLRPVELWGMQGFADFLSAIGDAEILVRDSEIVRTRNFLDAQTDSVLILAIFHAPGSGISTSLEIRGRLGGNAVRMKAIFRHLSFVPEERQGLLVTYCVALMALAIVVVAMDLWKLRSIYQDLRQAQFVFEHKKQPESVHQDPTVENLPSGRRLEQDTFLRQMKDGVVFKHLGRLWKLHMAEVMEILYTMAMGVIIVAYAVVCLQTYYASESRIEGIISQVINGPLFDGRVGSNDERFGVIQDFDDALSDADRISTFAFTMMMLLLVKIVLTTNFHPRVGLLTGTLRHSLGDLWHFALLFVTVFVCFSMASHSLFGERQEFSTLEQTMRTQFDILLGALPEDYWTSPQMVVYVVFANLIMFFLMLNFLLAIVVEGYTKVRQDIDDNQVEHEFFYDVLLSLQGMILGAILQWPSKQEWVAIIREDLMDKGRIISFEDIWDHYLWLEQQESENPDAMAGQHEEKLSAEAIENEPVEVTATRKRKRKALAQMFAHYRKYDDIKCKPMFMALKNNVVSNFLQWRIQRRFEPTAKGAASNKNEADKVNGTGSDDSEPEDNRIGMEQVQEVQKLLQDMQHKIEAVDSKLDALKAAQGKTEAQAVPNTDVPKSRETPLPRVASTDPSQLASRGPPKDRSGGHSREQEHADLIADMSFPLELHAPRHQPRQ